MGMRTDVYAVPEAEARHLLDDGGPFRSLTMGNRARQHVSLEKAWHGLHYLLTGSAWEESGPLAFIVAGGEEIPESDGGYGPVRLLSPGETAEINTALAEIDDAELWSRFDAEAMSEQGVYPDIWDEPEEDLRDEYLSYFNDLKKLVATAASRRESLLIFLA